ncbi:bifunctional hydroxymethylpyrimidine kinase/phosphomethylpyrimidine kinase [Candidatus Bipolaricaulota sp. J31]
MRPPRCLTIAGSDSGGGAGIQADLKTFEALGCFGMSAITALTAQNTREVRAVRELDPDFVAEQIDAVVEDIGVDAAKTGMLANEGIVEVVARRAAEHRFPLVVDPVMVAKSGARLLAEKAVARLREALIPLAAVITPNVPEAEVLVGRPIRDLDDAREAARELGRLGPAVLLKGGHLPGEEDEVVDLLCVGGELHEFRRPRIPARNNHGAGCVLSAAICARLAHGDPVVEAVARAEAFIFRALRFGLPFGSGPGPVQPMAELRHAAGMAAVLEEVRRALSGLGPWFRALVPEVGSNLAATTPFGLGPEEAVGVDGRIVRTVDGIRIGEPRPGGSSHMARFLAAVRERFPEVRAVLNVRFSEEILEAARRVGLRGAEFRRDDEPPGAETMAFGAHTALSGCDSPPDFVFDRGAVGKEPMVRILGRSADEVVGKARRIYEGLHRGGGNG